MRPYLMFGLRMAILSYGLTIAPEFKWMYFLLGFYGYMSAITLINEIDKRRFDRQVDDGDDDLSA